MALLASPCWLSAQSFSVSPVRWEYAARKVKKGVYELHMTAVIIPGWHIYAQHQPDNAIGVPTVVRFSADSGVVFEGKPAEIGHMKKFEDKALGISDWEYEDRVDFVEQVKVKTSLPVRVKGTIMYQACREGECLKPDSEAFSLELNAGTQ